MGTASVTQGREEGRRGGGEWDKKEETYRGKGGRKEEREEGRTYQGRARGPLPRKCFPA